jgi:hypothetical protein
VYLANATEKVHLNSFWGWIRSGDGVVVWVLVVGALVASGKETRKGLVNMYAGKRQEDGRQSAANSESRIRRGSGPACEFVDHRREGITHRELQALANDGPGTRQLKVYQDMVGNNLKVQQLAQLQSIANNRSAQAKPAYPIERKSSMAMAGAGSKAIVQRVSINLQPADGVIKKLLKYAKEELGVNDTLFESVEAAREHVLGKTENIYLFGHGGYSAVDVEEHDLFAGINMDGLADALFANVAFPKDYTGTIYLIGCKTDSLLGGLKAKLDLKTQQDLKIRGTTETLQTGEDGEIRLRDQPGSETEVKRREVADMQRYFYQPLITLKNARRDVLQEVQRATSFGEKRDAMIKAHGQRKTVDNGLIAIRNGLERLKYATSPKLLGKKNGLKSIEEVYATAKVAQDKIQQCVVEFLDLHEKVPLPENASVVEGKILQKLVAVLTEDRKYLGEQVSITALLVGVNDEPDLLQTSPFRLDQTVDVIGANRVKNLKNSRIRFSAVTEQIQGWTQTALQRTLLWKEINAELTDPQQDWSDDRVAQAMGTKLKKLSSYLGVLHRIQVGRNSPEQLYASANKETRRKLDIHYDFNAKKAKFNRLLEREKPENFIGEALDLCDEMQAIFNRLLVEVATESSIDTGSRWGFGFF